jgi:protein-arginine kinase activator protein McsA
MAEEFEEAARIRDEIRSLEAKMKKEGKKAKG